MRQHPTCLRRGLSALNSTSRTGNLEWYDVRNPTLLGTQWMDVQMMSAQHSQQSCEAGEHENGEEQFEVVVTYFAALYTETLANALAEQQETTHRSRGSTRSSRGNSPVVADVHETLGRVWR